MLKFKYYKFLIGFAILTTPLLSLFWVNNSNLNTKNLDNSLVNSSVAKNVNITPKPLNDPNLDLNISSLRLDSGRVSNDEVVDQNGNYILTASNRNNTKAKVAKLNYQLQYLYDWEYSQTSYKTRQVVADINDIGYYYALLVNENVTISSSSSSSGSQSIANAITFDIQNPALVVQLYDTGSKFETKNIYKLGLPNFGINDKSKYGTTVANGVSVTESGFANNIWDHVYVQEAIQETDENSKLSFIRNTSVSNNTSRESERTDTNIYVNDSSKSVIYKLLGSDGKKDSTTSTSSSSDNQYYILKQLYLGNANNMVYLKDDTTNKKMILLFGGNSYQNFWFYNFEVSTRNSGSNQHIIPLFYANYDFDPFNAKYKNETLYVTEPTVDVSKVLKKFFYLPFMTKNRISNLAWFVGGAKTLTLVDQKNTSSNSYVFLAMMQPNISDFDKSLLTANAGDANKKGTFGTPEQVSVWNESNKETTGSSVPTTNLPNARNVNPQLSNLDQSYNNTDVLVGSSSNNISYELFSPTQPWSSNSSNFRYPFTAIQSETILPVMTSEIAAMISVKPTDSFSSFPEEKIYLNTFNDLPTNSNSSLPDKFSLFNCAHSSNIGYRRFDFGKELISNPNNWNKDLVVDKNSSSTNQVFDVGIDPVGMSRILLNKNPEKSDKFINDGWANTASQKIISFSPQLTTKNIETTYGTYKQVAAVLVLRDAIYSFTYDFVQPEKGMRMVPVANFENKVKRSIILNSSSDAQKFINFLSISYLDNVWIVTFQDPNNSNHACYRISYAPVPNAWTIMLDNVLTKNSSKISKLFVLLQNNFLVLNDQKNIQIINTISDGDFIDFNSDSSISANAKIWGTIEPVSQEYLSNNNLLSKTSYEISTSIDLLNQLVKYSGGWSVDPMTNEPTEKPIIFNINSTSSSVSFDVALKFINGKYYSSASFDNSKYPNIVQNSLLNIPSFTYDGFATLAPWVIPAIAGGVVFLVVVLILVGIFVILSLHKNKKVMQKGFASSNKKIDTLTTAVGSVYKKILTQTKNNKSPQMLKSAKKSEKMKPNVKTPNKPISGSAPKKPA
ncbi:hypothetical protein [Mycoplasmoides pirum]|uniref:hypothetical protein n=1 Tax=Mycoplasmoides pirum TaxID=2122 RepID=UPI0004843B6A|nr:hypothetical protein [Mycoplasmoides pirum]